MNVEYGTLDVLLSHLTTSVIGQESMIPDNAGMT